MQMTRRVLTRRVICIVDIRLVERSALNRLKETQLRERVMALIEQEFDEVSDERVAVVLGQLVRHYETQSQSFVSDANSSAGRDGVAREPRAIAPERSTPAETVAAGAGELREAIAQSRGEELSEPRVAGGPSPTPAAQPARAQSAREVRQRGEIVQVIARSQEAMLELRDQIMNIGALLLPLDESPPLNTQLQVEISFEPLQYHVALQGRVVNLSARGTALELTKLGREDRVTLERMTAALVAPPQPEPSSGAQLSRTHSGGTMLGPLGAFGRSPSEPRFATRRQVSITTPDDAIVTSMTSARARDMADELYGPAPLWYQATGDPERVEALANDRMLDILLQLSSHGFTGIAELESERQVRTQISFDSGFLVGVSRRPRLANHELGLMLLAASKIDATQLAMAAAHADERGLSVSRALLELELMSAESLRHAIAGRLTFLLRELSGVMQGQVRLYNHMALPADFLPLPPLRVHVPVERTIFAGLFDKLRQLGARERDERAQADLDAYPEIVAEDRERLERALVERDHLRLVERVLNGRRRLREVFTESPLPGADTFAVVFALHRMGLVRFDRSLHHTVVRERFRENVTVKYLSVHKASYFEVLNVHWSSYDEGVKRAYDDLIVQFDPHAVPDNMEPEVRQRVREIRERVEAAYQVLATRPSRHAYRTRIMPEYKLAHAVPLFLKQCELAEKRGQLDDALDSLRRALEIAPENPQAASWRTRLERLQRNSTSSR